MPKSAVTAAWCRRRLQMMGLHRYTCRKAVNWLPPIPRPMVPDDCCNLGSCPEEPCTPEEAPELTHLVCPPFCPLARCPRWQQNQQLHWTNATLQLLWSLPNATARSSSSEATPATGHLILITITFAHKLQILKLLHCVHALRHQHNVTWIVVEDAAERSTSVARTVLAAAEARGIRIVHLAHGPTRAGGNAQRNVALKYIRRRRMVGVVYNMDDDNAYHPLLWDELRTVRAGRVGVLAVRRRVHPAPRCDGSFGQLKRYRVDDPFSHLAPWFNHTWGEKRVMLIDRPVFDEQTGKFVRFDAGWCRPDSFMVQRYGRRTYCVEMAGFAFDSALLWQRIEGGAETDVWTAGRRCAAGRRGPDQNREEHKHCTNQGGESELIERLIGSQPQALQPLANCGRDVLVFHNEYRVLPRALLAPKARCGG